jgi:asparagine synthase (glutamine-hydrolysing)
MCGIFGFISKHEQIDIKNYNNILEAGLTIKPRGPERTNTIIMDNSILMFHRLAIINTSHLADQPFVYEQSETVENDNNTTYYVLCNGEIYNYKELCAQYSINNTIKNDVDSIFKLFKFFNYDFTRLNNELNGEYALTIIKFYKNKPVFIWLSVDNSSVRPMFLNIDNNSVVFSSLLSGISTLNNIDKTKVVRLSGGDMIKIDLVNDSIIKESYLKPVNILYKPEILKQSSLLGFLKKDTTNPKPIANENLLYNIIYTLNNAVKRRLVTDRPLGCLLSGGLDSSLVASIASMYLRYNGMRLRTFTIGMKGGTDIKYAEMVAKHIDSDHTTIYVTEEEALAAIPEIIKTCETYDTTTIRASTFQYLLAKYISQNTDIKVLLNGDGADEAQMGYLYNYYAPSDEAAQDDNVRILREIHLYDGLRVDRNISHWGLEARLPFLDKEFTNLYLSIDPSLKRPIKGVQMEKQLIRDAYNKHVIPHTNINNGSSSLFEYLPNEVLYRVKEAFSDGVSTTEKSWYKTVQEYIQDNMTVDKNIEYKHMTPTTNETLYYRQEFERLYGSDVVHVIPHYWLPNWTNTNEPSARTLSVYNEQK